MDLEKVTVQDCIDMHDMKGYVVIINDGKLFGFLKGENDGKY